MSVSGTCSRTHSCFFTIAILDQREGPFFFFFKEFVECRKEVTIKGNPDVAPAAHPCFSYSNERFDLSPSSTQPFLNSSGALQCRARPPSFQLLPTPAYCSSARILLKKQNILNRTKHKHKILSKVCSM